MCMNINDTLIIAFNISVTYDKLISGKGDRDSIYDCTRHYWVAKKSKAEMAEYVFGVAHGKVVGVFKPQRWYYTESGKYEGRIQFEGTEIDDSPFLGMDLSDYFYKIQNPCRYIGPWL